MELPPRNCPSCGAVNLATAIYCISCRAILPAIPVHHGVMGRVGKPRNRRPWLGPLGRIARYGVGLAFLICLGLAAWPQQDRRSQAQAPRVPRLVSPPRPPESPRNSPWARNRLRDTPRPAFGTAAQKSSQDSRPAPRATGTPHPVEVGARCSGSLRPARARFEAREGSKGRTSIQTPRLPSLQEVEGTGTEAAKSRRLIEQNRRRMDLMQQPAAAAPTIGVPFDAEERMRLARENRRIIGIRPEGTRELVVCAHQKGTSSREPPPARRASARRSAYSMRLCFGVAWMTAPAASCGPLAHLPLPRYGPLWVPPGPCLTAQAYCSNVGTP